jgi:hypothetical protein
MGSLLLLSFRQIYLKFSSNTQTFPGAARLTFGTHLESDLHSTTISPPTEENSAETENSGSVITHNGQRRSHNELLQKPMKYEVSL